MYKVIALTTIILFMSGCSAISSSWNSLKCGVVTCEVETPVATEEVRG